MEVPLGRPHGKKAQEEIGWGSLSGRAVGGEEDASLAEGETSGVFSGEGPGSHQSQVGGHQQGRRAASEI